MAVEHCRWNGTWTVRRERDFAREDSERAEGRNQVAMERIARTFAKQLVPDLRPELQIPRNTGMSAKQQRQQGNCDRLQAKQCMEHEC